ncbi:MAG: ester cyclase [Actinobacteria bacterium]|nr:ester cyclase [Actinomycetota bacterium]
MGRNLDTARAFYVRISRGELSVFDATASPDFVDHDFPPGVPPGPERVKQWFGMALQAFPDMKMVVEDDAEAGDKVWARVRMTGTHQGEFMGMPPTGKSFDVQVIDILRFDEDGKVVEHWGVSQDLQMLQQLGIIPEDAGAPTAA